MNDHTSPKSPYSRQSAPSSYLGPAATTYWVRHLTAYLCWVGAAGLFSWFVLGQISLVGPPPFQDVLAYWLLSVVGYVLTGSTHVILTQRRKEQMQHWAAPCVWAFITRLMVGISLFPVVCVLFLNKGK